MEFSVRLRAVRKERGKKLKEAAACLGIATRTYQGYEGGENEPSIDKLIALADFYDVSLDYLMGRVDQDHPWRTGTGDADCRTVVRDGAQ